MKFLKTFFGQALRKADSDFDQQASRDGAVLTNIDYTHSKGGVVNLPGSDVGYEGLNVYKASDERSVYVTPGIFYTNGAFNETNGLGGGERGQLFTQTTFTHLPYTPPLGNGQSSYLVVYIKTIDVNYDPDPTRSSAIVTSKDVITGENIPSRAYTTGYLVVSNPMAYSQIKDLGGIPLAVLTTAQDGTITFFDPTIRRGYQIASSVDLMLDQIVDIGVPDEFFDTDMFGAESVTDDKFADSIAVSSEIARWDGATADAITGSGVSTNHLKDQAIFLSKISVTGSMNGFSTLNYLSNSSFESGAGSVSGWSVYNPSEAASVANVDTESYYGASSARIQGVILGQNPPQSQSISMYQDVLFTGNTVNGRDIGAFFYLKTDADIPLSTSGTTGIYGIVQYISNGSIVDSPKIFAGYSGSATDWIKLQSTGSFIYTGTSSIDALRFSISGSIGNANAYVDGAFLGLTNILPEWTPNPSDFAYGDTLNIENVNVSSQLTSATVSAGLLTSSVYTVGSLQPSSPHAIGLGSPSGSYGLVSTNSITVSGTLMNFGSRSINYTGNSQFIVPEFITSVVVEAFGGGGGGSAGADYQSPTTYGWGGAGGDGGWAVKSKIDVTPGDVLNIIVGSGGVGGFAHDGAPYYVYSYRTSTNGGITYDAGSGGEYGRNSMVLDSTMNPIITASGGRGGLGPWGPGRSEYDPYKGPQWFSVSGNTIYMQGTRGKMGYGPYADTIGFGGDSSSNISGGDGGVVSTFGEPSKGGYGALYYVVNGPNGGLDSETGYADAPLIRSGSPWQPINRLPGRDGVGIGAGGGGGTGGLYALPWGRGGFGGRGSAGLVRIYW